MSRVGIKPIDIPSGVKVTISGQTLTAEGSKGTLSREFSPLVKIGWSEDEKQIVCSIEDSSSKQAKALWGTTRALIQNMVLGVSKGYERSLQIEGVGWGAEVQGQKIKVQVGYATPALLDIPQGLTVTAEKQTIKIEGADKQQVGEFAARTRKIREPEPYNGKGIRYSDEVIKRKQGKQFGN
ncbi:MAG: 50S ribosomal protein L6 [Planctomycetota bacterium]